MIWPFLKLKGRNRRFISCSKIDKAKYLLKNSPLGRTEEQNDKQMTRNFDADCKSLFNHYCPMGNNILQVTCPGQYCVLLSACLGFNLLFLVTLSNISMS